ncbi:glutathione-independent formaldehyde dehydrogenase [Sciscionella marina]|uniref:glutathione-independent formaldehyde dehydrogenase n=1 Tax=Sciscionella marina TaxID=508770 RepID=UPI000375FBB2|nr:glutathione-independent formaldehyde dehydrogenase [Sciscionella marina]
MKALVYDGPRDVRIKDVPDPGIENPNDAVIRVTSTNICGSDLHMYEGRTPMEYGRVLGHENLGEVVELGEGVEHVRRGDRVCLPFNVCCGHCGNCERGNTAFCLNVDSDTPGGAYGFAGMGSYSGGQAEYLRVPWADANCLVLPEDAVEKENDYVMLADIFPTGYHATELADVQPGESVAVYGAGPVGLMAAYSAYLRGASEVMIVDRHPDRLKLAEAIGATAIDDSKSSPVDAILERTNGIGADKGCECVGFHAHDPRGREHPESTMNRLVSSVKVTGTLGVVGAFLPQDPGAEGELAQHGKLPFDMGEFWFKGQRMGTGQANVKAYNRFLRELIHRDRAKPSFLVSHELSLLQAPSAYENFDQRLDGWTKVILKP